MPPATRFPRNHLAPLSFEASKPQKIVMADLGSLPTIRKQFQTYRYQGLEKMADTSMDLLTEGLIQQTLERPRPWILPFIAAERGLSSQWSELIFLNKSQRLVFQRSKLTSMLNRCKKAPENHSWRGCISASRKV